MIKRQMLAQGAGQCWSIYPMMMLNQMMDQFPNTENDGNDVC
jgi:hypothetical protein